MLIHLVCGARPNFMKIAPLFHALSKEEWTTPRIVHTGQHYDVNMSDCFFQDLGLPHPHINLGVGSGTHAEQTSNVMVRYEKALIEEKPDLVIVVGDVNSTVAATLVAVKLGIKVAHLEAGLRSFDRTMPEEINRVVTDALSDILWTPSPDADANLMREGIPPEKIAFVGNIMIDTLEMLRERILALRTYKEYGLNPNEYVLVTLHRPSNVDDRQALTTLCEALCNLSEEIPVVFPIHPRTRGRLKEYRISSIFSNNHNLKLPEPLSYLPFMNLLFNSRFVLTDSGGIQEETTYLGIPCLTVRPNTERPITLTCGTNQLCSPADVDVKAADILLRTLPQAPRIEYWDGHTSRRIIQFLKSGSPQ